MAMRWCLDLLHISQARRLDRHGYDVLFLESCDENEICVSCYVRFMAAGAGTTYELPSFLWRLWARSTTLRGVSVFPVAGDGIEWMGVRRATGAKFSSATVSFGDALSGTTRRITDNLNLHGRYRFDLTSHCL